MAFIRRPKHWLVLAAFAAAFWVTFRVMAASPAPFNFAADGEIRDPALEAMITRLAAETTAQGRAR
jgi:hypothetical protein